MLSDIAQLLTIEALHSKDLLPMPRLRDNDIV